MASTRSEAGWRAGLRSARSAHFAQTPQWRPDAAPMLLGALSMILATASMVALGYLVWVAVNRQDPE